MPTSYPFLNILDNNEVVITVNAHPRSRKKKIVIEEDAFHVYVVEPPEQGKANKAILKLLSKKLKLPINSFSILSGATSKTKRISIKAPNVIERLQDVFDTIK